MIRISRSLSIVLLLLCATGAFCDERSAGREHFDFVLLTSERPIFVRLHVYVNEKLLADTWDERAREVFEILDRDNSAQLAAKELQQLQEVFGIASARPNRSFIGDVVRFLGNVQTPWDKYPPVDFEKFLDLWKQQHSLVATSSVATQLPKTLDVLSSLDTDHSQTLSIDELKAAREVLKRWDVNEDELITTVDLQQFSNPLSLENRGDYESQDTLSTIASLGSDEDRSYAVDRMLSVYGSGSSGVALDRWGLPNDRTHPFDEDQNQWLSIKELRLFLEAIQPDLDLIVRADPRNGSTIITRQQTRDVAQEGFVVLSETDQVISLQFGGSRLKLFGNVMTGTFYGDYYATTFLRLDADMNEYLEKKEIANDAFIGSAFELADADHDEKLFKKEFEKYLNQVYGQAERQVAISITDKGQSLFGSFDLNADDRLSVREQTEAARAGALWDQNGDRILAVDELPRSYVMLISVGVKNETSDPNAAAPQDIFRSEPNWFQRLDRNSDGDVSRREFPGPIELFEKLDSDGDGLLSTSEAQP